MTRRTIGGLAAALATACALVALTPAPAAAASAPPVDRAPAAAAESVVAGQAYPGDPELEALLVAGEERRLIEVRAISNAAGWTNVNQGRPYRLVTGNTYTLVLIRRDSPYTLDDLLEYAPSTFVRQPDGSYLLSENIVVEQGATLKLSSPDGLVIHLASTENAFVSIVTIGGAVELAGSADNPMVISGWDPIAAAVDTNTNDGRAYIRVTGGHAAFAHVTFESLGFWSGATGGVALTGTAPPDTLSQDADQNRVADDGAAPAVYGTSIYPADGAELLTAEPDLGAYSYVSADIDSVVSRDNAFGMFITSAKGVDIRNSTFENNLVDGLVLHRGVINTVVHNTTSSHNAVDGVSVTRAATGVILSRLTVEENGRNGITLEGGPLADGPSATGTPTGSYGNNEVNETRVADNGRYGIEIVGGTHLVVDGNSVSGQLMGIVVAANVDDVTVTDNIVENSVEQAIAFRGGVTNAVVQQNSVQGGEIGIYLRSASGLVDRNTVIDVTNHAIALIEATGATTITNNSVSGRGPSAIDVARAGDIEPDVSGNDTDAWIATKPFDVVLRGIFQPLTVMWITLGLIVVITAATGWRRRNRGHVIQHPYASHAPLSALTSGVADPVALGRGAPRTAEGGTT